jgi:Zn-dependent peptidase ImmA (M78 family)
MVLAHELGHAIFDLDSQTVSLDFRGEEDYRQLQERRAQSFAQELFAPPEMLRHIQNTTGFKWSALTPSDLAVLVSHAEVSASVILSSALDAELISEELRQLTPHALTTREFLQQLGNEKSVWPASHRTTNLSPRRLRLPVSYVKKVISAAKDEEISLGKAAEMLMMDRQTVIERFSADLGSIA